MRAVGLGRWFLGGFYIIVLEEVLKFPMYRGSKEKQKVILLQLEVVKTHFENLIEKTVLYHFRFFTPSLPFLGCSLLLKRK